MKLRHLMIFEKFNTTECTKNFKVVNIKYTSDKSSILSIFFKNGSIQFEDDELGKQSLSIFNCDLKIGDMISFCYKVKELVEGNDVDSVNLLHDIEKVRINYKDYKCSISTEDNLGTRGVLTYEN